jgi:hypothetical protein
MIMECVGHYLGSHVVDSKELGASAAGPNTV